MGGSSSKIFDEVKKAKDDSEETIEKIAICIKTRKGANIEYSGKVQKRVLHESKDLIGQTFCYSLHLLEMNNGK